MVARSSGSATGATTVLIAIADPMLQLGFETLLREADDCRPVGTLGRLSEVRDAVARERPDVLLLDVAMRRDDERLVPELSRSHPETRVIVLVDHDDDQCALRYLVAAAKGTRLSEDAIALLDDCCLVSLRASAYGCLAKSADPPRVLQAIRTVHAGEIAAAPWVNSIIRKSAGRVRRSRWTEDQPITARELEVIAMVARGLSNKDVASELSISEQTVKNHLNRVMQKLGLSSRLEVGLFAVKHNLTVKQRTARE